MKFPASAATWYVAVEACDKQMRWQRLNLELVKLRQSRFNHAISKVPKLSNVVLTTWIRVAYSILGVREVILHHNQYEYVRVMLQCPVINSVP